MMKIVYFEYGLGVSQYVPYRLNQTDLDVSCASYDTLIMLLPLNQR
jgi:hypothetical protein